MIKGPLNHHNRKVSNIKAFNQTQQVSSVRPQSSKLGKKQNESEIPPSTVAAVPRLDLQS